MIVYLFLFVAAAIGLFAVYSEEVIEWCDKKLEQSPKKVKKEEGEFTDRYITSETDNQVECEAIAPLFRGECDRFDTEFQVLKLLVRMRRDAGLRYDEVITRMGDMGVEISSFERDGGDLTIGALFEYARVCGYKLEIKHSTT